MCQGVFVSRCVGLLIMRFIIIDIYCVRSDVLESCD